MVDDNGQYFPIKMKVFHMEQLEVRPVRNGQIDWKVRVLLTFSPPSYEPWQRLLEEDDGEEEAN